MSQLGATIHPDDLEPGATWALISESAIGGGSGILAGSADIVEIIERGDIVDLFIFPVDVPPGLYLWQGTLLEDGEQLGVSERLHPDCMQAWLDFNGKTK
jgi:hypothetical protein